MQVYPNNLPAATLSRIRTAHVARLLGVSDHIAATIAAVYFAGVAQ